MPLWLIPVAADLYRATAYSSSTPSERIQGNRRKSPKWQNINIKKIAKEIKPLSKSLNSFLFVVHNPVLHNIPQAPTSVTTHRMALGFPSQRSWGSWEALLLHSLDAPRACRAHSIPASLQRATGIASLKDLGVPKEINTPMHQTMQHFVI